MSQDTEGKSSVLSRLMGIIEFSVIDVEQLMSRTSDPQKKVL